MSHFSNEAYVQSCVSITNPGFPTIESGGESFNNFIIVTLETLDKIPTTIFAKQSKVLIIRLYNLTLNQLYSNHRIHDWILDKI